MGRIYTHLAHMALNCLQYLHRDHFKVVLLDSLFATSGHTGTLDPYTWPR